MQLNSKIDGKFKIVNPIYDDKSFTEDTIEIHPKTCNDKTYILEESVDTASIDYKNENSNNDNYGDNAFRNLVPFIQFKKREKHRWRSVNFSKVALDNKTTIHSLEHHLSGSIISIENLNVKSYDCITRGEPSKDEFNLKAINIKINLVLKIENLKSDSHVPENFCHNKILPSLVRKNTIICLFGV